MKINKSLLFLPILYLAASCGIEISSVPKPTATVAMPIDTDEFTSSILSTNSYAYSGSTRSYELVKSQSGSKNPTYMQWIPNDANTTAGAVIIYHPYESIGWTGEVVDTKWFALPATGQPDEDGPYYNAATSSEIGNTPMPHLTAAETMSLFTSNNLHTVIVYGRYYSGTNIAGDVQVIVDAYRFLESKTVVDKTKIGIYSGSWGGIGVLYGTKAAAAYNLKPKTISLAYPVSDVKALITYIDSIPTLTADAAKRTQYAAFYEPYRRRIDKATEALAGQATRYNKYSKSELASIDSSIFVIHDDWDTLVQSSSTMNLFSTLTLADKYAYIQRHTTAIDYTSFIVNHSQATAPIDYTTALTWNYLFLIAELTDPNQSRVGFLSLASFVPQFQHMRAMWLAGQDTSAFRKPLSLLCTPNIFLINADDGASYSGPTVLAFMMSNYYQGGWAADGPSACAKLITNPPF